MCESILRHRDTGLRFNTPPRRKFSCKQVTSTQRPFFRARSALFFRFPSPQRGPCPARTAFYVSPGEVSSSLTGYPTFNLFHKTSPADDSTQRCASSQAVSGTSYSRSVMHVFATTCMHTTAPPETPCLRRTYIHTLLDIQHIH